MTSTPRQYGCTVPRQKNGRIAGYRENDIDISVMSRPTENQRLRAIGMLQGGLAQNIVARHFNRSHRCTSLMWLSC
jgi:hypothetical protein